MKVKRAILSGLIVLLTIILTGCPPKIEPPGDRLTAKEAWGIMEPAKETLSDDAVPVYIQGRAFLPERPITEGMTYNWNVGFYSESGNVVWDVGYYSCHTENGVSPALLPAEKRYNDVSLTVYDLADWNIDSPEACDIAAQNGAGETRFMVLQAARIEVLYDYNLFKAPEFISESTKLLWVIMDEKGDFYYIDACTGEYLGSYTANQINYIKNFATYPPRGTE